MGQLVVLDDDDDDDDDAFTVAIGKLPNASNESNSSATGETMKKKPIFRNGDQYIWEARMC